MTGLLLSAAVITGGFYVLGRFEGVRIFNRTWPWLEGH